jgi:hypothetical protein
MSFLSSLFGSPAPYPTKPSRRFGFLPTSDDSAWQLLKKLEGVERATDRLDVYSAQKEMSLKDGLIELENFRRKLISDVYVHHFDRLENKLKSRLLDQSYYKTEQNVSNFAKRFIPQKLASVALLPYRIVRPVVKADYKLMERLGRRIGKEIATEFPEQVDKVLGYGEPFVKTTYELAKLAGRVGYGIASTVLELATAALKTGSIIPNLEAPTEAPAAENRPILVAIPRGGAFVAHPQMSVRPKQGPRPPVSVRPAIERDIDVGPISPSDEDVAAWPMSEQAYQRFGDRAMNRVGAEEIESDSESEVTSSDDESEDEDAKVEEMNGQAVNIENDEVKQPARVIENQADSSDDESGDGDISSLIARAYEGFFGQLWNRENDGAEELDGAIQVAEERPKTAQQIAYDNL